MLEVKNLKTVFSVESGTLTAVDGISLTVPPGKIVGIVGESGSGKSITALSILDLLPANGKITQGEVLWNGADLCQMPAKEKRDIRGSQIGLILQNPQASLNPVFTIGSQMIETIQHHHKLPKNQAKEMAIDLLKKVAIPDAERRLDHYPHQFSMGMCQRIMIALTICMQPKLLIADEPTASLDVTIQSQVLHLLDRIRHDYSMSIILISHDLGLISQYCDDLYIMYLGKIVEHGSPRTIFEKPLHPYTQALVASIPTFHHKTELPSAFSMTDIPSPLAIPSGCRFHPRCVHCMDICTQKVPNLEPHQDREVACFLY